MSLKDKVWSTDYAIVAEGNSAAKQLNLGGSGRHAPQKNFEIYMFWEAIWSDFQPKSSVDVRSHNLQYITVHSTNR